MEYILEICAGSISSAYAAEKGGANRIELCDNLSEGGTTPSAGVIRTVKEHIAIPIFPIIRPRGGNFVYSNQEFQAMKWDIRHCREIGCDGIVFGILDSVGHVDTQRCGQLIDIAGPMQLTFHRAFDHCKDMERALEDIIRLGFHRILTSGGEVHAHQALSRLRHLNDRANGRICLMPGSGLNRSNIEMLARETGAKEFHSTAKFGIPRSVADELSFFDTDPDEVRAMRQVLDRLSEA